MGGKKSSSPQTRTPNLGKRSTPARPVSSRTPKPTPKTESKAKASVTTAITPRTRMRASEFASKKRSAKKRPREIVEDADDVDTILHGLRKAVDSDGDNGPNAVSEGLLSALKLARDAYKNDESGSSSSEEAGAGKEQLKSRREQKRKGLQEKSNGRGDEELDSSFRTPLKASKASTKKGLQASPKTPSNKITVLDGKGYDAMTPAATEGKSAKKLKSSAKRRKENDAESKKVGMQMKTKTSAHKRDIEALKKDDPEFYKFLEENDATLLDFDDDDDLGDIDADESDDSDADMDGDDEGDVDADGKVVFDVSEEDGDLNLGKGSDCEDSESEDDNKGDSEQDREMEKQSTISDSAIKLSESDSEDNEVENLSKESKAVVEDITGYSDEDDEDGDDEQEAKAAAEAGLELNGVESNGEDEDGEEQAETDGQDGEGDVQMSDENEPKSKPLKMIFVDMDYLRGIKEQLKSKRSSLKAAKELLRLFRAGKEILPGQAAAQDKKAKLKKKRSRKHDQDRVRGQEMDDMEKDYFADDGSFSSGKVRFASAKTYQLAMNLAITGVQDALDRMLGMPEAKKGSSDRQISKWDPTENSRWFNLQPVFRSYVYHMLSLCDVVVDPGTSRFLLKRLERLVPYTRENKILLKRIIKIAVRIWSADALHMSEATRLRAYLLLNKLAHGPGNAEAVLRSCCSVYASSIANVCNPRTLPSIQFATTCIVELFGVDMGASYTTAFANLRELAISLRAVLVSKEEKDEVERIHNWSYINRLRLWSKVLGKYGRDDELQALIYPYVQVSLGVMRVHATPRTFPLRLHVASYLSDLVAQTGTFIPLAPHLLSLLRCSELRKKPGHGNSKALEWRSILRVSSDTIKTKPFLTGVLEGVILHLAKFFATISKHVSFPEIAHVAEVTLRKFAKEVVVGDWKSKVMALVEKIRQTSELITEARANADFAPQGAVSSQGMLGCVPGIDLEKKTPIQRFFEVEFARIKKEETLRDEKVTAKQGKAKTENGGAVDVSDESNSDSESEHASKRTKKSKPTSRKQSTKTKQPLLSIVNQDDEEEDVVQDLELDSDDSDE